jgi:hypothetical protein
VRSLQLPTPTTAFDVALVSQLRFLQAPDAGTTGQRPVTGLYVGQPFFDTTLGLPVWWRGDGWVNAVGATV